MFILFPEMIGIITASDARAGMKVHDPGPDLSNCFFPIDPWQV